MYIRKRYNIHWTRKTNGATDDSTFSKLSTAIRAFSIDEAIQILRATEDNIFEITKCELDSICPISDNDMNSLKN